MKLVPEISVGGEGGGGSLATAMVAKMLKADARDGVTPPMPPVKEAPHKA